MCLHLTSYILHYNTAHMQSQSRIQPPTAVCRLAVFSYAPKFSLSMIVQTVVSAYLRVVLALYIVCVRVRVCACVFPQWCIELTAPTPELSIIITGAFGGQGFAPRTISSLYSCVCVCVWRERERERERG